MRRSPLFSHPIDHSSDLLIRETQDREATKLKACLRLPVELSPRGCAKRPLFKSLLAGHGKSPALRLQQRVRPIQARAPVGAYDLQSVTVDSKLEPIAVGGLHHELDLTEVVQGRRAPEVVA